MRAVNQESPVSMFEISLSISFVLVVCLFVNGMGANVLYRSIGLMYTNEHEAWLERQRCVTIISCNSCSDAYPRRDTYRSNHRCVFLGRTISDLRKRKCCGNFDFRCICVVRKVGWRGIAVITLKLALFSRLVKSSSQSGDYHTIIVGVGVNYLGNRFRRRRHLQVISLILRRSKRFVVCLFCFEIIEILKLIEYLIDKY